MYATASRTLKFSLLSHVSSVSLTVLNYFCQHIHMLFVFHLKPFDLTFPLISCSVSVFLFTAKFVWRVVCTISIFFFFSLLNSLLLGFHTHHSPKTALVKVTSDLNIANSSIHFSVFFFFNMFVALGTTDSSLLEILTHLVSLLILLLHDHLSFLVWLAVFFFSSY